MSIQKKTLDASNPPGVLSSKMSSRAFSFAAFSILSRIYSEVTGWIAASSMVILKMEEYPDRGRNRRKKQMKIYFFTFISL